MRSCMSCFCKRVAPVTSLLQVEASPYHYDSHVQLIRLLRQLGDLDGARKARNAMSEVFPLTEGRVCVCACVRACVYTSEKLILELWLEWLRDELPLVSVPEAGMELRQLFERATEDYLCEFRVQISSKQTNVQMGSLLFQRCLSGRSTFNLRWIRCQSCQRAWPSLVMCVSEPLSAVACM